MPRLLSNLSDAPMLGEAALLWQLSIQPEKGFPAKTGGGMPTYVYIVLAGVFLFGVWRILESICTISEIRRSSEPVVWTPKFQVTIWAVLMFGSAVTFWFGRGLIGIAMLLVAVMLPIVKRKKASKGFEDWPDAKPAIAAKPGPTKNP